MVGRFFLRGWWLCFSGCGVCVMLGYCGFGSGCWYVVIVGWCLIVRIGVCLVVSCFGWLVV